MDNYEQLKRFIDDYIPAARRVAELNAEIGVLRSLVKRSGAIVYTSDIAEIFGWEMETKEVKAE